MRYNGHCNKCGLPAPFDYPKNISESEANQIATLKCDGVHPGELLAPQYGACVYCGQISSSEFCGGLSQEELNKAATRSCDCAEAQYYTRIEEQVEAAKDRIGTLFGDGAEEYDFVPIKSERAMELMENIALLIAHRQIRGAQIQITGRIRAKIAITSKGNIKVERSETKKYQLEE